ncbi:MAG: DUF190 domain-containing protein [Elusimicrobiales bacterium]
MSLPYTVVRIFTSEEARHGGKPLHHAVVEFIHGLKISARCLVARAADGCFENGDIAASGIEALSHNMPLEITVIMPSGEKDKVIPALERMVEDGIMIAEEKDVLRHKCRKRLIPRHMRVRDVMTPNPKTVPATASAAQLLRLLWQAGFHSVPVVDADGRPAGMATNGDLVRRADVPVRLGLMEEFDAHNLKPLEDALEKLPASRVMTSPAVTVPEDEYLDKAADIMLRHKLKRLPVTGGDGKITGILSRLDIFKTILDKNPDWRSFRQNRLADASGRTAGQAMRGDTPVLAPDAPLSRAIELIESTDIKRVAVTDSDGKLLGLISDSALLSAVAGRRGLWDYLSMHLPFLSHAAGDREAAALSAKTTGDIMSRDVISAREADPLEDAVKLMVDKKLKRIPVVDAAGVFRGMLTRDSILRAELHSHEK